jgi:PKD repeat protein
VIIMERSRQFASLQRGAALFALVACAAACSVAKQEAPSLAGPSGFAQSLIVTAAPQILSRDGSSMSTISVIARNPDGTPMAGRRLRLSASAGTLTVDEVNTANDGKATATYIAPDQNVAVDSVTIFVTPVEAGDRANTHSTSVRIEVLGPDFPVPSFNVDPETPARFQPVTFNASPSTFGGVPCGAACSYAWDFGDGSTDNRMVLTHPFQNQGAHIVTLTVTSPAGTFRSTTRVVTVGPPLAPTASLTFSPTNPTPATTVNFDASGSQALNGATIVEYRWNFGGATSNGGLVTASPLNTAVFGASATSRTYVVTVTVVDSNAQTATTSTNVTVAP